MTTAAARGTGAGSVSANGPDAWDGGSPSRRARRSIRDRAPGISGIVVGVDGSDPSISALHWALEEGAVRDTPVEVVYAWEFPPISGFPVVPMSGYSGSEIAESALEEIMTGVADQLTHRGPNSPVNSRAIEGRPSAILIEEAATAQLLVVGTRGRGGFAGLLLGSVSQQCTAHAFCPVVVVHEPVAN